MEVKLCHRWLGIVFSYSREFPRSILFSSIGIMFIQSAAYPMTDDVNLGVMNVSAVAHDASEGS